MSLVKDPKSDRRFLLYFALGVILAGLTYLNLLVIRPISSMSDFAVEWSSARGFLVSGQNPYGKQAFDSANDLITKSADPGMISYHDPFYRTILQFPLAAIPDFDWAAAVRMSLLEVAAVIVMAVVYFSIPWQSEKKYLTFLILILFAWPPMWLSIATGESTILILMWIGLSYWALRNELPEIGGVTLAFGFTNHEIFGLALVSILLWVINRKEWRYLAGFLMTFGLLLALAHIFNPEWYLGYLGSQIRFWQNGDLITTSRIFEGSLPATGLTISRILSVIILALILFEWQTIARRDKNAFLWIIGLALAAPAILGIGSKLSWLSVNLVGIYLIVARIANRWKSSGFWLVIFFLALIELFTAFNMAWFENGSGLLVLSALMVILLYWVRWDSTRTTRLWADILEEKGLQ